MRVFFLGLILVLYFASGISLTSFNKFFLSKAHYGFIYPFSLIFCHMTINCLLSGIVLKSCYSTTLKNSPYYPSNISRRVFLTRFVPIGLLFGADITLTNVSFRFVSISLTEVVKSAVPALIFLFNLARGRDRTTSFVLRAAKLLNVALICAGVAFTAKGEVAFEIHGFLAAAGATLAATVKLLYLEELLAEDVDDVAVVAHGTTEVATASGRSTDAAEDGPVPFGSINSDRNQTNSVGVVTSSSTPKFVRVASNGSSVAGEEENGRESVQSSPEAIAITRRASPRSTLSPGGHSAYAPVLLRDEFSSSSSVSSSSPAHAPHGRLHPILSLFYFTPVSAAAILPWQLYFERSAIAHSSFVEPGKWQVTVLLIVGSSLMAFMLNCSELFVIQETSALTLCIWAILKFLIVILVSIVLFNYEVTPLNVIGIALAVCGLVVYNFVKWKEAQEKDASQAAAAASSNDGGKCVRIKDLTHDHHQRHLHTDDDDSASLACESTCDINLALERQQQQQHDRRIGRGHSEHSQLSPHTGNTRRGVVGPPLDPHRSTLDPRDALEDSTSSSSSSSSVGSVESLLPQVGRGLLQHRKGSGSTIGDAAMSKRDRPHSPSGGGELDRAQEDIGSRLINAFNAVDAETGNASAEDSELEMDLSK